jgi:cytochrome c-type biogenesis protein CcmH/NrfG
MIGAGLIGAVLMLGACSSQRSLDAVERSGDRSLAKGDYETARKEYKEYVDRRPGKARVQHALGTSYMALNQPAAAALCFSIAHDLEPANPQYTEAVAEALYAAGDRGKLYEYLHGLTEQPGAVADYNRLAMYASKLGDADEAQIALLTAARIDGGTTVGPQMALADFYRGIGDRENALTRLRMALHLDPENPEVAARIRELGEIPGPSYSLPPEEARQAGVPTETR